MAEVDERAAVYEARGLKRADARHLARAVAHKAVTVFITADEDLLTKVRAMGDLPARLRVVDSFEAVAMLDIQPGEEAPIRPASSNPLRDRPAWWIR